MAVTLTGADKIALWQFYQIKIVVADTATLYRSNLSVDGFKYTAGVRTSGGFGPGGAEAQSLSFIVLNRDGAWFGKFPKGTKVELYAGFGDTETGAEYAKVATLYVETCNRSRGTLTVTCYDKLHTVGDCEEWTPVSFPTTTGAIIQSCASQLGMQLASASFQGSDIPVDLRDGDGKQPSMSMTIRQALSEACLISCNYARADRDGKLVVDWFRTDYADGAAVFPKDNVMDYDFSEQLLQFSGVKVGTLDAYGNDATSDEYVTYGVYTLESGAFLTASNQEAVRDRLYAALCYKPHLFTASVTAVGGMPCDIGVTVGRFMTSEYYGPPGEPNQPLLLFEHTIPVCGMSWDGSMCVTITCPTGDAANADDLRPKSGNQQIRQTLDAALSDPDSEIRKRLDALYKYEGGGGGEEDPDDDIVPLTVMDVYRYLRPSSWMKMPAPSPYEMYLLMTVPDGLTRENNKWGNNNYYSTANYCQLCGSVDSTTTSGGTQTYYKGFQNFVTIELGYTDDGGNFVAMEDLTEEAEANFAQYSWFLSMHPREWAPDAPYGMKQMMARIAFTSDTSVGGWNRFMPDKTNVTVVEVAANLPNKTIYDASTYSACRFFRGIDCYASPGIGCNVFWGNGQPAGGGSSVDASSQLVACDITHGNVQRMSYANLLVLETNGGSISYADNCRNLRYVHEINVEPASASNYAFNFSGAVNLKYVGGIYAPDVKRMSSLAYNCTQLRHMGAITMSAGFTALNQAFQNCSRLKTIGGIGFIDEDGDPDYSNTARDISNMFYGCTSLTEIPSLPWPTGKYNLTGVLRDVPLKYMAELTINDRITALSNAFNAVGHIGTLTIESDAGVSGFTGTRLVDKIVVRAPRTYAVSAIFGSGSLLERVGEVVVEDPVSVNSLFSSCSRLDTVDKVTLCDGCDCQSMFYQCTALTRVEEIDIGEATNAQQMFYGCASLAEIGKITGGAPNMYYMFYGCQTLDFGPESELHTPAGTTRTQDMFSSCKAMRRTPLRHLTGGPDANRTYSGCDRLVDMGTFDDPDPLSSYYTATPVTIPERVREVHIGPDQVPMAWTIQAASWDIEMIRAFLDELPDGGAGKRIWIACQGFGWHAVTDADKAIATGKGYEWYQPNL